MKFPNEPRKGESIAQAFSELLRWCRANNVVGIAGGAVRESSNGKTLIPATLPGEKKTRPGGRFLVSYSPASNRLYVSPGSVGVGNEAYPDAIVRPMTPTISGSAITDSPAPFIDDLGAALDYEIICIFDETSARIVAISVGDPVPLNNCERAWLLATIRLQTDDTFLKIEEFSQRWASDIPWTIDEVSCDSNQSTGSDSGDTSGGGSDSTDSGGGDEESSDNSSDDSSSEESSSEAPCTCPTITGLEASIFSISNIVGRNCFTDNAVAEPVELFVSCIVGNYCEKCANRINVRFTINGRSKTIFMGSTSGYVQAVFGDIEEFSMFGCSDYPITAQVIATKSIVPGGCDMPTCDVVTGEFRTPGICSLDGSCGDESSSSYTPPP